MNHMTALLKDKDYIVDLLNGPCMPSNEKREHTPINPDWVDMEASASVTEAFHNLLPKGIPYQTYIIVERNPDTLYGGTCVDANEKRLRYFVISVIPDTEFPLSKQWVHLYLGAEEFLKNKKRYCLWLIGAKPSEISKCPTVKARIQSVRDFRMASKAAGTRKFAETPSLFCQIAQPQTGRYIAVPKTSSERRRYIPLGFLDASVIASDLLFLIPDAELFHFGVLESNVHMAWMRTVCGRLKSDYRYSKDIVYNNFPWPTPTDAQKAKIEQTAQAILDARALYPDCSLADLYDEVTMPPELRKAHQQNDKAVMEAYGMSVRETTEATCVAELMRHYQKLAN